MLDKYRLYAVVPVYTPLVLVVNRAQYLHDSSEVVSLTRAGFGRAVAMASRAEQEETGSAVSRNLKMHDTAASAAGSDAISKGTKLLGDAFGRYLYDEKGRTSTSSGATASSNGNSYRPSDKQMGVLRNNGYSDEQVAGMDFKTWKGVLDAIFKKETPSVAPAPATKSRSAPQPDEIPF